MRLLWLALLVGALGLVQGRADAAVNERSCHVENFETPVRCVTLDVPRDYDKPDAGTLKITAVIIPANTGRPSPDPVVLLAGGPGQPASTLAGLLPGLVAEARKTRDVVLFDLRGMGLSESLNCPGMQQLAFLTRPDAPAADMRTQMDIFARRCLALHGDKAMNHTSREAVEDLERFRQAMGYPALNLWGGSFGTRIAQHYVRAYGRYTRAVVLDAAAPVGLSVLASGASSPDRSLEAVLAACEKNPACAARYPSLRADLAALLTRLDAGPATGIAPDPVTGKPGAFALDRLAVGNAIRTALYGKSTAELLPFAITEAARENWAPMLGISAAAFDETLSLGAQFSALCAEDWRQADALPPAERTGQLMKDGYYSFFSPACAIWPMDPVPPDMLKPFKSNVPALVISGAYDPVTPPELGERAVAQFEKGHHLIVPNGFHGNSTPRCLARMIGEYIATLASPKDEDCISRMPSLHFFMGAP